MKNIKLVEWEKCNGEAHRPEVGGMIDHCMVCMPYWGKYPICPTCKKSLNNPKNTKGSTCKNCGQAFRFYPN